MILPIKIYGNSILRKVSVPITEKYPNLNQLIDDMFETMHKAKGVGLAAIQIGLPVRIFVIEATDVETQFYFKGVFINPNIIKFGDEKKHFPEGCLSIPKISGVVERPDTILIEYFNQKWEKKTEEFEGWKSRMIQHEYEHLQGELYTDNLSTMWKSMLTPALDMIKNGKIQGDYLTDGI